jgi:hypothetical protein
MNQPQPPTPPSPEYRVQVGTGGVKVTRLDTDADAALRQQAELLKTRLEALTKEIEAVKAEMSAPGAGPLIASNQVRLTALEGRRTDAEEALQRVEDQIAGIDDPRVLTTEVAVPPDFPMPLDLSVQAERNNTLVIWLAAIVCIGLPISVAFARSIWKRTTARVLPPAPAEDARRLERVEQAVDAIAIEMERMSEGQRYVTKLLAERADRLGVERAGGGLQENQETPPTRVAQR